jgi:hypothetical protein
MLFLAGCGNNFEKSPKAEESNATPVSENRTIVARVAEFTDGIGLEEFIKDLGYSDKYLRADALQGESTFFIAPEFPEYTIVLYPIIGFYQSELVYDMENPIARAGTGQGLVFSCTVPEGIPEIMVVVDSNYDGGESTVWQWYPGHSGVDGSLVLDDNFVSF